MQQGRKLDQALYAYHFEGAPADQVLTELARYQNEDGGFGRALEPDLRAPASSAIATSEAFQVLRQVGLPRHEMAERAVGYLLRTYDPQRQVWEIVPPAVEDAPHAPWWTYAESAKNFGGFLANPRAAILGHLYDYADYAPAALLEELTQLQVAHLDTLPDHMEMHDYQCYRGLAEAQNLPAPTRRHILDRLAKAAPHTIATRREDWSSYGLQPLWALPEPGTPLADALSFAIDDNLDFWIETQLPDGSWPLPWSWAFVDAPAWQQAERDWKGRHIVNHLRTLHAFHRTATL
jgi:hypothetical protein